MDRYLLPVYGVYITCAVGLTVWLARTLFRSGSTFLADVFSDKQELATAVNRLLVTGFFMINLGFSLMLMQSGTANSATQAFQLLSVKLGVLLFVLAVIHFVNLAVFFKLRQHRQQRLLPPPIAPQRWIAPPPSGPAAGPGTSADLGHLPPPPDPAPSAPRQPVMSGAAAPTDAVPDSDFWEPRQ